MEKEEVPSSVTAHGLVNHDGVHVFFLDGLTAHDAGVRHISFKAAVLQINAVLSFDDSPFGAGCG